MFHLISARPSPYGRKVAIALLEKGLAYDVRYDVPWADGTCVPEYSPLEQLPILITPKGEHVYDSRFILEWLERKHPAPALLPADVDALLAAKKLPMLGERAMEAFQLVAFKSHRPDPSQAWLDRQSRKIAGGLREMDRLTADHAPSDAEPIRLSDIAVGTTLAIIEFAVAQRLAPDLEVARWRGRHANLTRFSDTIERRPSFAQTRPQPMEVDLTANVG